MVGEVILEMCTGVCWIIQIPQCSTIVLQAQLLLTSEVAVLAVAAKVVVVSFWEMVSGQSKTVPVSHPKPIIPLFRAVVNVMTKLLYIQPYYCHLVLITHLLSLSKIRAFLRAFYTMRYIDDAKGGYTFEKYSVPLPYKEIDDR